MSREKVQKFGRFLSGMVMPNISAFIAWGLITAFFIPSGWLPNQQLSNLVNPMVTYLLPLLIGYTGGKAVGEHRGGVVGAIATMGVVVGANIPMFIGAMVMGPLGGLIINKFDKKIAGKIPAGFEMIVNTFSAGIFGALLALLGCTGIGPVVLLLNGLLKAGVENIVRAGLLPLASLLIEPGKILFLNNAINHGILGPIGIQQAQEAGKSIFFLLETNPGPGLGILLAYWLFSKSMVRQSATGAMIIHFFGGIHEIYFPYVLMNPLLLIAVICGGASGVLTFSLLGAGLVATPAPGSIFALLAMTPKGGYLAVLAGVMVSTLVSFVIAAIMVKIAGEKADTVHLNAAREKMQALKGQEGGQTIKKVIFACDAGMGSSAMGANSFRNRCAKEGYFVEVVNCAIADIPADAEVVVTHRQLAESVSAAAPKAEQIPVMDYLENPVFEILKDRLQPASMVAEKEGSMETDEHLILRKSNIRLGLPKMSREEAIKLAGQILYEDGYVDEAYISAMLERERDLSTYIGKGIAIPHGIGSAKEKIKRSGMVVLQFPDGVLFGKDVAYLVIGIAGAGNEHLSILANIATAIDGDDDSITEQLRTTGSAEYIYNTFTV